MPPLLDPDDVYAATRPGKLSPVVRRFPARVYVPNGTSGTVDVIDARTFRRVGRFPTGQLPQHVTPSWDLRTLWVGNNQGNSLTPIDPATGRSGRRIRVADPYNLYFTPNGRRAIVVAERLRRLDFRDPHTMRLRHSLPVPCFGVDHLDFSADGRSLLASCEFSGHLVRVDVAQERVLGILRLRPGAMPQDVKLAPDGRVYYVADMGSGGVWVVDAAPPAGGRVRADRQGRSRAVCQPRLTPPVCLQPRRGIDLVALLRNPQGRRHLAAPRRRQP